MDNESPIGTMVSCIGKIDEEKWIICDGSEYDNSDNRFEQLLEIGFGTQHDNKYISPNFNNMTFVYKPIMDDKGRKNENETINKIINTEKYTGHMHYLDGDNSAEAIKKKYFNIDKDIYTHVPHLVDYIKRQMNKEDYNNIMKWIIRYR
jgi:hypothetical protein